MRSRSLPAGIVTTVAVALAAGLAPISTAVAQAGPRVVQVRAVDYAFEAPKSIPAGTTTFVLQNVGREIHHLWIVKLEAGKTPEQFTAAMKTWGSALRMPPWAVDVGGPNSAASGEKAEGTMTLEPGTYMLVCWVPSPDGMLHVMKGMIKPLTVTATGATAAAEPTADIVMTFNDYSFELSKPLAAGRHTIRFENIGKQSHEAVIARLLPGKTLIDAMKWTNAGQFGPPPEKIIGGASGIAPGRHMYATMTFASGRYALLCFIPDTGDGKPHSDHGMMKEIVVP